MTKKMKIRPYLGWMMALVIISATLTSVCGVAATADPWSNAQGPDRDGTIAMNVAMAAAAPLAGRVDLSASQYFPPIGNQGNTSSCAAWALTYYQFGFLKAKELNWSDASTGNASHLFSPSWTYNMVNDGVDNGSNVLDNVDVIKQFGAATLDVMPFSADPSGYLNWGSEAAWRSAVQYRCQGYTLFEQDNLTQFITFVKQALDNGIPVNFNINSSTMGDNFADSKGNWNNIISSSEYLFNGSDHLQTVVGYDDNMSDLDASPGAFKVANSYGTDFGIAGYYFITYDAFKKMANYSFAGIINMSGSQEYQPSTLATLQFGPGPTRDADLTVKAVQVSTGQTMAQFVASFKAGNATRMPSFLCLDISDLLQYMNQARYDIVLTISDSNLTGTVSSFKVELYHSPYQIGQPYLVTPESADVPKSTPGSVTAGKVLTVPTSPRELRAVGASVRVSLSWTAPASDGGSAITGYKVYIDLMGGSQLRAVVGASTLSYQDNNVSAGSTYTYHVVAVNAIGESAASAQVQATPQSAAADNTMLYVGIAVAIIVVIAIAVVVMRRKK